MAYKKPQVLAQNSKQGSYAAGCPANVRGQGASSAPCCKKCEISG